MKKINKDILNSLTYNIKDTSLKGKIDGYRQKIHNQALEAEYADYEKGVDDPEFRDIYEAIRRYQYGNGALSGKPRKVHYSDDEIKGIVKNSNKENPYDRLDKETINNTNKKLN